MVAIVAALCAATWIWGEQIGINGGMGWDGQSYVQWAEDIPKRLVDAGTTQFHAQRVLPSVVVWGLMQLTGRVHTTPHLVEMFRLFDIALLLAAAWLWAHLAIRMRWRRATSWVGFVALFGCFANARHALYYPALTDTAALLLGLVVAWAYLLRHPIVLWGAALASAFTWPALTLTAFALLLLPRQSEPLPEPDARWRVPIRGGSALLALAATALIIGLGFHYLAHPVQSLGMAKFATWVRRDWLVMTVPLLAAVLLAAWYLLLDQPALGTLRALVHRQRVRHIALALAGIAAILVVRAWWLGKVGTRGPGPTGAHFLCQVTLEALRGPLWGVVHHVVYFGPIVLVAMLCWPGVCRTAASWGHGTVLALVVVVAFSAASESRQFIHLFPLLVAATVAATDTRWTPLRAGAFAALALVWSKVWLSIGYNAPGDWRVFPTQRYFMQLGPWASDTTWAWHLAACVLTTGALWLLLRRRRDEPSAPEAQTYSSPVPPRP